jgi:CHRD domain
VFTSCENYVPRLICSLESIYYDRSWCDPLKVKAILLLGASFLTALPAAAAPGDATFHFRLSPGPRLVGTRADTSGSGSVTATLEGNKLTLKGSFSGLLGLPTSAHLLMGSMPGVRGPLIAPLTVSAATSGTLSGSVELTPQQVSALRNGGLYVEIDSAKAPEGDLWGWIMRQ